MHSQSLACSKGLYQIWLNGCKYDMDVLDTRVCTDGPPVIGFLYLHWGKETLWQPYSHDPVINLPFGVQNNRPFIVTTILQELTQSCHKPSLSIILSLLQNLGVQNMPSIVTTLLQELTRSCHKPSLLQNLGVKNTSYFAALQNKSLDYCYLAKPVLKFIYCLQNNVSETVATLQSKIILSCKTFTSLSKSVRNC